MTLPLDRTLSSTPTEHLGDHNIIHAAVNAGAVSDPNVGIRYVAETGLDSNDGFSWQSAFRSVMAAALDLNGPGLIQIGKGIFMEAAGIPWKQGMTIQGINSSHTDVRLDDGEDADLFVSDPALPITEFLHWSKIRNMKIRIGNNPAMSANLIQFNCRVGEDNTIENVVLHPGNVGIQVSHGGQPIFWNNIHSFGGGIDYAIKLQRTAGDIFNSVTLQNISGDNNGNGLIFAQGFLNAEVENLTLIGIKSESGTHQQDTIVLQGMECPVVVMGASVYDVGGSPNSLVKIPATSFDKGSVTLINCVGGMTNWIDDVDRGITLPKLHPSEKIVFLSYETGEVQWRLSNAQMATANPQLLPYHQGLAIKDNMAVAPSALAGAAQIFVDTDGDLKVKFADGFVAVLAADS